jgi:hypothetical protein
MVCRDIHKTVTRECIRVTFHKSIQVEFQPALFIVHCKCDERFTAKVSEHHTDLRENGFFRITHLDDENFSHVSTPVDIKKTVLRIAKTKGIKLTPSAVALVIP